ncbi:serine protease [Candidatus Woesearchaeota archaeon]|jgi:S1-C subfamily serine protease|nr:serine protease [Candidatus Woesearchaeota archaeon]
MGKKTISAIAAAIFATTLGASQQGCVSTKITPDLLQAIDQRYEQRNSTVRNKLDDMLGSVHCLRVTAEYKLEGSPEGAGINSYSVHGSAFAYAKKDGYTYIITNAHIATREDEIKEKFPVLNATPDGVEVKIEERVHKKQSETAKIVTNKFDTRDADDIELELVVADKANDVAILRTKTDLHVSDRYILDKDFKPEVNDKVLLLGYPGNYHPLATEGRVSHLNYVISNGQTFTTLDVNSAFGSSGSPYFIQRGDKLYWAGLFVRIMPYERTKVPLFELGIPLNKFADLLDTHQPVVEKEAKKEGE